MIRLIRLSKIYLRLNKADDPFSNILFRYKDFGLSDKKQVIDLISPATLDRRTGIISSFQIDKALLKVLYSSCSLINAKECPNNLPSHFSDRNVSIERAITLLGRNNIHVNDDDVAIILDFFYVIAKNYIKPEKDYLIENKIEEIELYR